MKTSSLQLPSLAGTLSIKSMLQRAPKHVIFIFWGGGTAFVAHSRTSPLGSLATGLWEGFVER